MTARIACALMTLCCGSIASASFTYMESINGELSADHLAPSDLTLELGVNRLTGTLGQTSVPFMHDIDYVTMTVPAGMQLDQLNLIVSDVGGAFSFLAVEQGDVVTNPWTSSDASPLMGWTHYGSADQGLDLLPRILFSDLPPLQAGNYTFWIMELNSDSVLNYTFDFVVSALPFYCNDIDFNNDGSFFDPQDIDAFLSTYSEGPCIPETATCDSIDYNNDTSTFDPCDIDSFLTVFAEGPCTSCGE